MWLSLVERTLGVGKVAGSNPVIPTKVCSGGLLVKAGDIRPPGVTPAHCEVIARRVERGREFMNSKSTLRLVPGC